MEIDLYLVSEILRYVERNTKNREDYLPEYRIDIPDYDCYVDQPGETLRFHIDWVCEAGFIVYDILDIGCKTHRGISCLSQSGKDLLSALDGAQLHTLYQVQRE